MKGNWRGYCVWEHVYISVGKSNRHIANGNDENAGRGLVGVQAFYIMPMNRLIGVPAIND